MSGSRINALFRTAVMWSLFTLFLLIGLASMFSSLLLGPFMLVAALVFAPPINRLIEKRTHITVKARHRVAIAFVCTGLFFYTISKIQDINAEKRAAQRAMAEQQSLAHPPEGKPGVRDR